MKRRTGPCLISLVVTCLWIQGISAQNNTAKVSFEVATIKPAAPLDLARLAADAQAGKMPKIGLHLEGDRAEFTYMSLRDLITIAYKVKRPQITGPSWMASERFDIVASLPEGASKDMFQECYRTCSRSDSNLRPIMNSRNTRSWRWWLAREDRR